MQGITDSLEEIVGPYLPIYVKTVLLPFEDRIIYDSLLSYYPIQFGGGYRSSLNDTYRHIQERGGIITKLSPTTDDNNQERIRSSNKLVLTAFQKALGASGLSPNMIQEHTNNIADFASKFLSNKTPSSMLLDLSQKDIETYLKLKNDDINLVSFKRFIRFLRETGRLDWDESEQLLDFLKRK